MCLQLTITLDFRCATEVDVYSDDDDDDYDDNAAAAVDNVAQ